MKIFNLPDLGEGLAEAEIVRWHVNTGDHIKAGQPAAGRGKPRKPSWKSRRHSPV